MKRMRNMLPGIVLALCFCGVVVWLGACGGGGGTVPAATPFDANYDAINGGNNLTPAVSATHGAVAGTVTDAAGGAVNGATVTLDDATRSHAGTSRSSSTDMNGVYSFDTVEPASYRMTIAGPAGWSYTQETKTANVVANQVTRPDDAGGAANTTVLAGGPTAPSGGNKWRGAKIYDDWRFYNTACGTTQTPSIPGGQRCRACHGWQGEASIGNPARTLVARLAVLSKAQVKWYIENHAVSPTATVGANTLDLPFGQKFVSANVRGVGTMTMAQKVADLVEFLKDTTLFGTPVDYTVGGNAATGQTLFENFTTATGKIGCGIRCHGTNGETIDFHKGGTDPTAEWIGDVANGTGGNELAFRIKFGHPRPDDQQDEVWAKHMPAFLNPQDPQQGGAGNPLITNQNIKDLRAHEMTLRRAVVLGIPPEAGVICP